MLKAKMRRLALYLGACEEAIAEDRDAVVTSRTIEEATGIHATQVRRDLSSFGKNGKRGFGYRAEALAVLLAGQLDVHDEQVHDLRRRAERDAVLMRSAAGVL